MVTHGTVGIALHYFGTIAKWTGIKKENLEVEEKFETCMGTLRERVNGLTEGKVLYSILYNGSSVSALDPPPRAVKEGDIFTVVPVILGG
jgi:molybdopterin converting factor small subunit